MASRDMAAGLQGLLQGMLAVGFLYGCGSSERSGCETDLDCREPRVCDYDSGRCVDSAYNDGSGGSGPSLGENGEGEINPGDGKRRILYDGICTDWENLCLRTGYKPGLGAYYCQNYCYGDGKFCGDSEVYCQFEESCVWSSDKFEHYCEKQPGYFRGCERLYCALQVGICCARTEDRTPSEIEAQRECLNSLGHEIEPGEEVSYLFCPDL